MAATATTMCAWRPTGRHGRILLHSAATAAAHTRTTEGCQYSDSSCCTLVLMDQSVQQVVPAELKAPSSSGGFGLGGPWRGEVQPTVRPGGVVVFNIDAEDALEMPSAMHGVQSRHGPHRPYPPAPQRVGSRAGSAFGSQ